MSGFKSILIAGSTGYVGERVTNVFLNAPNWTVSILVSPDSLKDAKKKPTFDKYASQGAKLIIADVSKPETYKDKLHGIDVILSALGVPAWPHQEALAKAGKEAGVKLFVPSEYGFDVTKFAGDTIFDLKIAQRKAIEAIGIPYTYIQTGPFFEYLFSWPVWGVDLANKKVTQVGPRSTRVVAAPFEAVVSLLPIALNDPANINKAVQFGYEITTGEVFDFAVEGLGGKDKVTIASDTLPEIEKRIAANPDLAHSFGDRLLYAVASERALTSDLVDGSKYGKRLPTLKEFAPGYIAKALSGSS